MRLRLPRPWLSRATDTSMSWYRGRLPDTGACSWSCLSWRRGTGTNSNFRLRSTRLVCTLALACASLVQADDIVQEYNRAWALYQRSDEAGARSAARELIAKAPTFYRAYRLLAIASTEASDASEAERLFQASQPPFGEYGLGELKSARGRVKEAQRHYLACVVQDPEFAPCYSGFYSSAFRATSGTVPAFRASLPSRAPSPLVDLAVAGLLFHQNKFNEAISLLGRHVPLPSDADLETHFAVRWGLLTICEATGGDWACALVQADALLPVVKKLGFWDDWERVSRRRALALVGAGNYDGAASAVEDMVRFAREQNVPGSLVTALAARSQLREKTGQLEGAIKDLEQILAAQVPGGERQHAAVAAHLGTLCMRKGDFESANRYFRRSYKGADGDPGKAFALRGLAGVAAQRGDFFQALQQETESVRLFAASGMTWQAGAGQGNIAEYYAALGDYESSRKAALNALQSARRHQDSSEVPPLRPADCRTTPATQSRPSWW
jgi:tetratricopeptide (TPR) repeat protein